MINSNYKKPPDKLRTMKCSFNSIFKNKELTDKIFDAVNRTNQIVIHTYQFLRLYILYQYHKKQEIININENTIKMAFKIFIDKSCGPKPKGDNLEIFNIFTKFFDEKYKKLYFTNKISGINLSQILNYMAIDMLTNIENNIKLNFISYVKKFVNSSFKKINNEILENAQHRTKVSLRKQLNKDLYEIKEDLFNNTLLSNEKYHEWINKHRLNIFPLEYVNSYEFDVKNNPQKYFKYMIYMCLEIEKFETKSFQFFPLRTNIKPHYIPIDTKSICELLIDDIGLINLNVNNKNDLLLDISSHKHNIWKEYFNLDNPIFKQNNYSFDYRISTDCFSVSIQLIHNDFIEKSQQQKINMKNKKEELKDKCKNMNQKEKEEYKKQLNANKKIEQDEFKLKIKEIKDKQKAEFKKLLKDEDEKEKVIKSMNKNKKIKNNYIEFPYLEDLNDKQLEELNNNNWCVVDPGRRCLLYMKNKNGKRLRYTNKEHIKGLKRLKYNRLLQNYKDKTGISDIENYLSKYNSKTCDYKKFKKFIKYKNKINDVLLDEYKKDIFRKYKWYGYINKKKTESKLITKIKKTFGKDAIINFGNWNSNGGKASRGFLSTPNLGLKRKLNEHFTVYNLDEFRTSLLNCKTEEKNDNLYLPDKQNVIRKIHSVLTFQTESNRMGCINRDENSVNNMIKIVNYYLEYKDRPEKFKRSFKLENK